MTEVATIPDEPTDTLGRLVAAYLRTRKSDHTRRAYRHDLTSWLDHCAAAGTNPLDAWPANVQIWLADLTDRGESGSTRARRLAAVSSWYGWLLRHQAAARNPATLDRAERPVRAPRKAPALSDEQAAQLLATADADSPRAAAIIWLLLYTGIRVGELLAANVADLGMERGHPVLHVHGKGGKTRTVPIVPPVSARLAAYLHPGGPRGVLVPAHQAGAGTDRPLIATAAGKRLDRKEVRRQLLRLARKAGLPQALVATLTPHSTRATYATAALDDGVPVRDVQYALGHASPVTTEGYDRSSLSPERSPAYRLLSRFSRA